MALIVIIPLFLSAQDEFPKKITSVEGITEYQLENGLKVLLFPDPSVQTITVNITYLVGSRHEAYGETGMAHLLESLGLGALPLMIGFILVIILLDFVIPGSLPKWAIFAPVFVPVFYDLDISPQALLAAYRIGDSPVNPLTPLMVYLPFIVTVAQRYKKESGIGTIISLMLPYSLIMGLVWVILFILWYVADIALGPGYPFSL